MTDDYQHIIDIATSNGVACHSVASVCAGYSAQQSLVAQQYASTNTSIVEYGWDTDTAFPITLVKPLSRGSIVINSSSIQDPPVIDYGTFSHPSDIEILVSALRLNRELIQTPALQALSPVEVAPGLNVSTDDDIKSVFRQQAQPTYSHPCCACPMMPRELGGVVDSELRVYGVRGLRIVDASVMPIIPATHLSATVYAIAEKAADMIRNTWQC